jgi:hypothetical protein
LGPWSGYNVLAQHPTSPVAARKPPGCEHFPLRLRYARAANCGIGLPA